MAIITTTYRSTQSLLCWCFVQWWIMDWCFFTFISFLYLKIFKKVQQGTYRLVSILCMVKFWYFKLWIIALGVFTLRRNLSVGNQYFLFLPYVCLLTSPAWQLPSLSTTRRQQRGICTTSVSLHLYGSPILGARFHLTTGGGIWKKVDLTYRFKNDRSLNFRPP